jgi:hypothetical protein
MSTAARSTLRAQAPRPRNSRSQHELAVGRALTGAFAAIVLGVAAFAAIVTTVGWLLAVSTEARSSTRSVMTWDVPLDRLPWQGPLAGGMVSENRAMALALAQPEPRLDFDVMPARNPIGALALVMPDPDITGSLGDIRAKPTALERALARLPLPKVRPRLASLGPVPTVIPRPQASIDPRRTAVYDIAAKTVYLPNGERLEAHSGLGELMDDPRSVQRKNRGVTPPNVYTLKLRESLFHGVRALRMTPANENAMFGRAGILAHSYMLGPNGQSNGCVSFKDYDRFLRAYLDGEVDRIVVVTRLARPPALPARSLARNDVPPTVDGW